MEIRISKVGVVRQNFIDQHDKEGQALQRQWISSPKTEPRKIELPSEAINERRLEGNHDPPADRIVSAVYCLNEVRRSTFEVRSYQRQHAENVCAHSRSLHSAGDALDNLLVRLPEEKHISDGAKKRIIVERRGI